MKAAVAIFSLCIVTFTFCLTAAGQTKVYKAGEPILDFEYSPDGKIRLLTSREVITIAGSQEIDRIPLKNREVKSIISLHDRSYIVLNDYSFYLYKEGQIIYTDTLPEMITASEISAGQFYIGTAGRGVFRFSLDNRILEYEAFENEFINDIIVIGDDIFVAADDGVVRKNRLSGTYVKNKMDKIISHIRPFGDGILCVSEQMDLILLDCNMEIVRSKVHTLGNINEVTSSMEEAFISSPQGIFSVNRNLEISPLFYGTNSGIQVNDDVLFFTSDHSLFTIDILLENITTDKPIYTVIAENETIWAGSDGEILEILGGNIINSIEIPLSVPGLPVSALLVYGNKIFAGTMGEGMYVFDKKGNLLSRPLSHGENNKNNIIDIQYNSGKLWIAYLNGLLMIDPQTFDIENDFSQPIGLNYIYCFLPVNSTEFYIGTSSNGLIYYKNGEINRYLKNYTVQSLTSYNGEVYIGCEFHGLFKLTEGRIVPLIPGITVQNLDSIRNNICINTKSENIFFLPEKGTYTGIYYDGLKGIQLNSFANTGEFSYVGYQNGILKVNNDRVKSLQDIGLILEKPFIFNEQVRDHQNEFSYFENTITFRFNSTSYYDLGNTYYKYRLIGLDSIWYETKITNINFYNLTPGKYTFEVAVGLRPDFIPGKIQSYTFVIRKPFWNQGWFYAFSLFSIISIIYFVIREREKQLLLSQRRENDKIKYEFEQLKNQIDPHFLFNSLNSLIGIIEENPALAIQATEILAELYRNILKYEKTDLIPLTEELNLAAKYFKIHQLRYENLISLSIMNNGKEGKIVPLSCQFLIENIIKHNVINSDNRMEIAIVTQGEYLVISNIKKPKNNLAASPGIGLKNLENRYRLISRKPVIIENTETEFIVKIPVIYD